MPNATTVQTESVVVGKSVQQRIDLRLSAQLQVRLSGKTCPTVTYLTQDVGLRGMFLRAQRPLAVGERVQLSFALPREGTHQVSAEVVWNTETRPTPNRSGMGLRFLEIPTALASGLRRFLGVDTASERTVVIVDDDRVSRAVLRSTYEREGMRVVDSDWSAASDTLGNSHSLAVIGANAHGGAAEVSSARKGSRAPMVVVLSGTATAAEWLARNALFSFNKPADPERVVRLSLSLVR